MMRMHEDEIGVDEPLVRHLLSSQFPDLSNHPLRKVEPWGTDNAVWRLGEDLVVRLPRIHRASGQVDLEATWLPRLTPILPVAVPKVIAVGDPDATYPWPWGVYQWLPGAPAGPATIEDPSRFAMDLSTVMRALRTMPVDDPLRALGTLPRRMSLAVPAVLPTPVISALPGTTRKSVHKLRRWRAEGLR
jgi:aminoglycoside phosphotransferase (APT) family kinase protein